MDADFRNATTPTWTPAPDAGSAATDADDTFGYPSDVEMTMEALAFAT